MIRSRERFKNFRLNKVSKKKNVKQSAIRSYQYGGFLSYYSFAKHKYHMMSFNKAFKKFEESKKGFESEYDSYIAESKNYKQLVTDLTSTLSDWIVAYKSKLVLEYLEESHSGKNKGTSSFEKFKSLFGYSKGIDIEYNNIKYNLKTATTRVSLLEKEIKSMAKQAKKDNSQYVRLNYKFKKNLSDFGNSLKMISNITTFRQNIKNLYKRYLVLNKLDKNKLSKKDINYIQNFEKYKSDYLKVLSLTTSYINNANKFVLKFGKIRYQTEKNAQQIERNLKDMSSSLDNINAWRDKMHEFLTAIDLAITEDKNHLKKIKLIKDLVKNIAFRYKSVSSSNEDMKKLKSITNSIEKIIEYKQFLSEKLLKIKSEFLNYQPAIRIQYETSLIYALNFRIVEHFKIIKHLLSEIK